MNFVGESIDPKIKKSLIEALIILRVNLCLAVKTVASAIKDIYVCRELNGKKPCSQGRQKSSIG